MKKYQKITYILLAVILLIIILIMLLIHTFNHTEVVGEMSQSEVASTKYIIRGD